MWQNPDDNALREMLANSPTIAMVGASDNPERDSNVVMKVLQQRGFRVIPVNPVLAGKTLLGETVVARLKDLPVPVDIVDVFRRSDAVPGIVEECLTMMPKMLWLQLGVIHEEAAGRARGAGMTVVMDRCIKIEVLKLNVSQPG